MIGVYICMRASCKKTGLGSTSNVEMYITRRPFRLEQVYIVSNFVLFFSVHSNYVARLTGMHTKLRVFCLNKGPSYNVMIEIFEFNSSLLCTFIRISLCYKNHQNSMHIFLDFNNFFLLISNQNIDALIYASQSDIILE